MKRIIEPNGWAKEASKAVEKEVRARYEERLKKANWWRRLVLELIILREANREMKRKFPPTSLYLQLR
ncbi:MAG TPA: hypothetical protein VNQ90_13730 [Chthoniobacteraceae bacterium]|nr:hypothetical protein [Chthoniobacteraceae bacterium]